MTPKAPRIAASDESEGLLFAEALRQFYNGEAAPRLAQGQAATKAVTAV